MSTFDLQEIRKQLDKIDREIVTLFEERMRLCGDVAEYKIENGRPVYDGDRERQKLESVKAMTDDSFQKQAVEELFSQMMTISRRFQYKLMAEHGLTARMDFQAVKGTETFYDFTGCTSGLAHQKIVGEQFAWESIFFQSKGM